MRDFYEVLGVSKDASASDIKRAYHRLAMEYHPDRNPGDSSAEEKFKEAANAYKVLADADQRARYDQFGHAGLGGGGGGFQGFRGVDDIFSAFGDIFGDFFGGSRGRGPRRGADMQVEMALTFAEAVHGATKDVDVTRQVACTTCDGSGAKPGSKVETCRTCNGNGQVVHSQGFFMVQTVCPSCRGAGRQIGEKCPSCRGGGLERSTGTLSVSVPAGVENGTTLRLSHKGQVSPDGGPPGHLYVVLRVADDSRFVRDGQDVVTEVPISYLMAILGGTVEVPTLDDNCQAKESIKIKPGTQPGDIHVRRNQGVAAVSGRGRGDHVLRFRVQIPTKLSRNEREALEGLAAQAGDEISDRKTWFRK